MDIEKLGIKALQKAFQVHEELGDKGLAEVQENPHGETSLVGDIEAEKAVLSVLRDSRLPIRVISEEHGETILGENPKYLAVLDGLDGTEVYKIERGKGKYGTMLGIFSNPDPKYEDYLFGGIMEHSTRRLFFASRGKGSFILSGRKRKPVHCSNNKMLSKEKTRIYADLEFDRKRNITYIHDTFTSKLKGYKILCEGSTAAHYMALVSGDADLVLECTRKGNLEMAAAYGLVTEAGGVMATMDGASVGGRKYLELGQKERIPIVSASTMEMAKELIDKVR